MLVIFVDVVLIEVWEAVGEGSHILRENEYVGERRQVQ